MKPEAVEKPSPIPGKRGTVRRIATAGALFGMAAVSLVLVACGAGARPAPTPTSTEAVQPSPTAVVEGSETSPDVLARGAELYVMNCQVCHGDREGKGATGGAPSHNETGHTWHHPDAQINDWILNGKFPGAMPPFRDKLNEDEAKAILAYIKTWWTPDQRESQADVSRRYQEALEKQKQGQ